MAPGRLTFGIMSIKIGIIGAGKVGTALAICLNRAGYTLASVTSRTTASARQLLAKAGSGRAVKTAIECAELADILFITTPDDAISAVVSELAQHKLGADKTVIHCSGALSREILRPVTWGGARALTIHPLQTFASAEIAVQRLRDSYFGIEAEPADIQLGRQIVHDLGGKAVIVPAEMKPLYHMAACIASNYLVVIADIAAELYGLTGLSRDEALTGLLPLIEGTATNLREVGLPDALTGPISRGDIGTVQTHLDAAAGYGGRELSEIVSIYRLLGLQAVKLAEEKGTITPDRKQLLSRILQGRREADIDQEVSKNEQES